VPLTYVSRSESLFNLKISINRLLTMRLFQVFELAALPLLVNSLALTDEYQDAVCFTLFPLQLSARPENHS
jgi:hypothetical protein